MDHQVDFERLKLICDAPAVSGCEGEIHPMLENSLKDFVDHLETDEHGNLHALRRGRDSSKTILFTAHVDQVGFKVTGNLEPGFATIKKVGAIDNGYVLGQRLVNYNNHRVYGHGYVNRIPAHFKPKEERERVPTNDFVWDYSDAFFNESGLAIVNEPLYYDSELVKSGFRLTGRALDNRLSVYLMVHGLQNLLDKPAYNIRVVFTAREELGCEGAIALAESDLKFDTVIVLDGAHALDTPQTVDQANQIIEFNTVEEYELAHETDGYIDQQFAQNKKSAGVNRHKAVTLGSGVKIALEDRGVTLDYDVAKYLQFCAADMGIAATVFDKINRGGAEASRIKQRREDRTKVGLIGVPVRNMHSNCEMADMRDLSAAQVMVNKVFNTLDLIPV